MHVRGAGMTLLVDCGATSLVAMRQQGLDPAEVDAVVVSHLHGDHFGGIPFLILHCQFAGRVRPLTIAGPAGVRDRVLAAMEVLFPGSAGIERRFETRFLEIPGDLSPVAVGAATVRAAEVVHASGAPPLALRVDLNDKTLAYSGDTEWTDALTEVSQDADVFICEAYTFARQVRYHLNYATLRERLPHIRARRVIVTHMSADMLERASQLEVTAAHDGLELAL